MQLFRHLLPFILIASIQSVFATEAPPAVRAEINALFKQLQVSGCQFNRNGSWYSGEQAQAHLSKKIDYLEKKDQLKTTEDFINLAASSSSTSGQSYLVRCNKQPTVESKVWLLDQLKMLRNTK